MISKLSKDEQKILEVKYAQPPVWAMGEVEIQISASAILLNIHVITGWVIPEDELLTLLVKHFIQKMKEDYSTVNVEEVEYAFRKYGTTVKDWGKSMNLSLIDEVMKPYLEARKSVSLVEEQESYKELDAPRESLEDQSMQDWLDEVSKKLIAGMKAEFLPAMLYDWLDRKGLIVLDTPSKKVYMDAAAVRIKSEGELPELEKVKNLAKRLALNDYILKNHERTIAAGS